MSVTKREPHGNDAGGDASVVAASSPATKPRKAKRPRKNLSKQARRAQILDAALVAFGRGGYHGTHVEHIVQEAGVARGTFYLHFESKHDVFAALVDHMLEIFLAAPPDDIVPVRNVVDARRVLTHAYGTVLSTFRSNRHLCRLLFDEAVGIDKGFAERLAAHQSAWQQRVRSRLARLVDAGVVRDAVDLDITAELVIGMVERLTRRYVLADEEPDLDALVAALVDLELRGVTR